MDTVLSEFLLSRECLLSNCLRYFTSVTSIEDYAIRTNVVRVCESTLIKNVQ